MVAIIVLGRVMSDDGTWGSYLECVASKNHQYLCFIIIGRRSFPEIV